MVEDKKFWMTWIESYFWISLMNWMNFTISEALLQFQMSIVFEILYKTAGEILLLNNIRSFLGKDSAFIVIYIVSVGLIKDT